mgnify:CR=1 FL=1
MKKFVSLLLTLAMVLALAACGGTASPAADAGQNAQGAADDTVYTLKFGHDANEDSSYHAGALALARLVEERSNGRLKIEVFPSGSLGSESELLESARMGVTDIVCCSAANASAAFPELGIFSVSFLFENQEHFDACMEPGSDMTNELKRIVDEADQGVILGTPISQGLRSVEATVPVHTPEDLKGLTMRVMSSETEILVWSTLGALPSTIPTGECYSALQTGVIDALENSPAILYSWKFYEVAPYVSLTEHEYLISGIWVSEKVQDKLPADLYEILMSCMDDAAREELEFDKANDQRALEDLRAAGANVIEDVDKQAFIDVVTPLRDKVAADLGVESLIEMIDAAKA